MKVVAICGKRCTGKDTFAALLKLYLDAEIQSLAYYFKKQYAQAKGLDLDRLLHDREYKEIHRKDMNATFETWYKSQPNFCCQQLGLSLGPIVIISDVRLRSDLAYLQELYDVVAVRIKTSDQVRTGFGWHYDNVIDEHFTEVDMDSVPDDQFICIANNGTLEPFDQAARALAMQVKK